MNQSVLTDKQARQVSSRKWMLAVLIAAISILLFWILVTNRSPAGIAQTEESLGAQLGRESVARPEWELMGSRAPDQYASQLDALRRKATMVTGHDEATAYSIHLEALTAAGRKAYMENRLPTTTNGYSVYLDGLRRDSMNAQPVSTLLVDANGFSQYLDELRWMTP